MTSIRFAQVQQAADFITAGKNPWMTVKDGIVQGVYVNRDGARSAKTGAPSKYNFEGLTLIDGAEDLPTSAAVADGMGHTDPDASEKEAMKKAAEAREGMPLGIDTRGPQESDASEFADDKAADVEVPDAPSVAPIPPVAEAPKLPADAVAKAKPDVRHQSEIMRPTKLVWAIADEMLEKAKEAGLPAPTRKEVMAECDRRGIAFYTARTQYQVWKSMQP